MKASFENICYCFIYACISTIGRSMTMIHNTLYLILRDTPLEDSIKAYLKNQRLVPTIVVKIYKEFLLAIVVKN